MSYRVDLIAGGVSLDVRDQRPATAPYNETTQGAAASAAAANARALALEARALAEIGLPSNWIAEAAAQARWTGATLAATIPAGPVTVELDATMISQAVTIAGMFR